MCDLSAKVNSTVGTQPTTTVAPTTTQVASEGPTTTLAQELPKTGDNTNTTLALAALLLGLVVVALAGTRRKLTV